MAQRRKSIWPGDTPGRSHGKGDLSRRKRMLAAREPGTVSEPPKQPTQSEIKATLKSHRHTSLPKVEPEAAPADDKTITTSSRHILPLPAEKPTEPEPLPADLSEDFVMPVAPPTPFIETAPQPTDATLEDTPEDTSIGTPPPLQRNAPAPKRKRRWGVLALSLSLVAVICVGAMVSLPLLQEHDSSVPPAAVAQQSEAFEETPSEPEFVPDVRVTSALDDLSQQIEAGKVVAQETAGRLFDDSVHTQLNDELSFMEPWVTNVRTVNNTGLNPATADQVIDIAQAQVSVISALTAELETEARNWDWGQEIQADLEPLFTGGRGSVAVWDANTRQPIVQMGADEPWVPASTFKVFTAYSILKALDEGEVSSDNVVAGWSLDRCFNDMIIESHNDCAGEWLHYAGYDRVENEAHEIGATSTYFAPGDIVTTANDLQHFFQLLHDKAILSDSSREYLEDKLTTHNFRHSIPAMMYPGDETINKVGFLDALHNDVGLVRTPHGDYTIAIMTDYLSWNTVRQAASIIRAHLEPTN